MSSPPPTSPPPMVWPPMPPAGFPLPWGQSGCCPSGGMDSLLQCYNDVQAATAFICAVMVQCVQNNPAVVQAIIAAIEASGSTLPLVGVTNGSDAQPGQVGEWVHFAQTASYTTAPSTQTLTMGVLPPGDWDCWVYASTPGTYDNLAILNPLPAGFPDQFNGATGREGGSLVTAPIRGLTSVQTLIALEFAVNQGSPGSAPGTATITFVARRAR